MPVETTTVDSYSCLLEVYSQIIFFYHFLLARSVVFIAQAARMVEFETKTSVPILATNMCSPTKVDS